MAPRPGSLFRQTRVWNFTPEYQQLRPSGRRAPLKGTLPTKEWFVTLTDKPAKGPPQIYSDESLQRDGWVNQWWASDADYSAYVFPVGRNYVRRGSRYWTKERGLARWYVEFGGERADRSGGQLRGC